MYDSSCEPERDLEDINLGQATGLKNLVQVWDAEDLVDNSKTVILPSQ